MSARDDKAPLSIQVHSTVLCSSQPFSPHSFLPSVPSFSFLPFLYLAEFSPPFSFSSSSSSSSCQAFVLLCCSDTFLKHVEEREKGKTEGERMEGRRKKRGKVSEKVRDESAGHFLSHCCGERNRESESAKRELGDQRQTDCDRDGEVEKQRKKEGNRYVKRDSSVFGEVRSISLLLRCQHYFSHPHFLMFSLSYYPPVYCSLLLFRHLHLSVFSLIPRDFLVTDSTNCQCRGS